MKAPIRVVTQEEYDKWYADKVKAATAAANRVLQAGRKPNPGAQP